MAAALRRRESGAGAAARVAAAAAAAAAASFVCGQERQPRVGEPPGRRSYHPRLPTPPAPLQTPILAVGARFRADDAWRRHIRALVDTLAINTPKDEHPVVPVSNVRFFSFVPLS